MFRWSKSSQKATEKSKGEFLIATGEDGGFPLILRLRSSFPEEVDRSGYGTLLAIHWDYEPLAGSGMPSQEDRLRMDHLVELLVAALEPTKQSYLSAIVTCNGVKEWQWYTRDLEEAMSLINSVLSGVAPFPVKISAEEDLDWEAYYGLLDSVKERDL